MFKLVYLRNGRTCEDNSNNTLKEAMEQIIEWEGNGDMFAEKIVDNKTGEEFDRKYIDKNRTLYDY